MTLNSPYPAETRDLDKQVGGDHYKTGIQPFALSMANGHDGCTHAMQKYMTRHRRKPAEKGYEDCRKAHRIAGIRYELMMQYGVHHPPAKPLIRVGDYIAANRLEPADASAVRAIESWHERVDTDHKDWLSRVRSAIRQAAIAVYHPDLFKEEDFA